MRKPDKTVSHWVDFKVNDLTDREVILYTQEKFESMVKDTFEAVQLDEDGQPLYIFTKNFVIFIINFNIVFGDIAMTISPRNFIVTA